MDFLKDLGLTDDVIYQMKINNNQAVLFNLICARNFVKDNIDYFNGIGIDVVDLLLIYRPEIFINDPALVKKAFEGYDLNKIVELINNDINAINLL